MRKIKKIVSHTHAVCHVLKREQGSQSLALPSPKHTAWAGESGGSRARGGIRAVPFLLPVKTTPGSQEECLSRKKSDQQELLLALASAPALSCGGSPQR